jgi:hypothetical protein
MLKAENRIIDMMVPLFQFNFAGTSGVTQEAFDGPIAK